LIRLGRWIVAVCVVAFLGVPVAAFAQQDALDRIDALQTLSDQDNAKALKELHAQSQLFELSSFYEVKRAFLSTLINVEIDAGRLDAANIAIGKLLDLAQANKDDVGVVLATVRNASLLATSGKTEVAIVQLTSLEPVVQRTQNPEALWRFYLVLGSAQNVSGKFEAALASTLKSLDYAKSRTLQSKASVLRSLNELNNVYAAMKNEQKAIQVIDDALTIAKEIGATKMMGTLYLNQGNLHSAMGQMDPAVDAYEKALRISVEAGLIGTHATALNNIGDTYLIRKDYVRAEVMARRALAKYKEAGEPSGAATAQCNIGFALMGQGRVKEGAAEVHSALKFFSDSSARADEEAILEELARMYAQAGFYREAYDTIQSQQKLAKELFNADRARSVATLQEQFDSVQREKQIELLARENSLKDAEISNRRLQQIVTILGAIVTVMAGIFMFMLYRKVRKANEKLHEANKQLEFHSVRDPLTGLYNRRSFLELMKQRAPAVGNGRREDANTDGLMILDIDHFKHINDTLGHAGGDTVLVEIAKRLRSTVRDSDMVMRWGGEEFLVYSPKANAVHLKNLAQRILKVIGESPIEVGSESLHVTVTGGFLSLPFSGLTEEQCDWEKAMQIADMALYLGKVNGRNRAYGLTRLLVPFEAAMPVLERDISAAIKAEMVELVEVVGPETPSESHTGPATV
jgi:diguanylate cyclase (GGDEF)-like protein